MAMVPSIFLLSMHNLLAPGRYQKQRNTIFQFEFADYPIDLKLTTKY